MDSSAELQIWNNAAFDNGEISEDLTGSRQSWGSVKSFFGNPKASFDSVSGKENQGNPNQIPSSISLKPSFNSKPLNTVESTEKSKIKGFPKKENEVLKEIRDKKKIDEEIEEVESEIKRLKSRLENLRLEKAENDVKKSCRVVAAKFMEEKQKVIEEVSRTKVNRRGISLGPVEIQKGRRGMSIGPSEILKSSKETTMITPLQSSRRKSCFWKLQDIEEEEKVKCSSVVTKSGKPQIVSRQAVTTIGTRKTVKKEQSVVNSVQPKKLFKDGEKSVLGQKKASSRPGRVVPSRYNQGTTQASALRKRSLPETDDGTRGDKKRSLSVGKSRVKKKWEIPSEIVVHGSEEGEKSPMPIVAVPDLLPRLRIMRGVKESPRDSGPAKKVVELIGKKSFFGADEDVEEEESVCQALSYPDEEGEEN